MKQNITQAQLDELSERARYKYATWCDKRDYLDWPWGRHEDGTPYKGKLPLLSIGQMIEFLEEHLKIEPDYYEHQGAHRIEANKVTVDWPSDIKLADALWEEYKTILEK